MSLPAHYQNLIEPLLRHAERDPERVAVRHLIDGRDEVEELSYGGLLRRVTALAGLLQMHGDAGDRALILLPNGLDFAVAFYACLFAERIAVPLSLPRPRRPSNRVHTVLADCSPKLILTTKKHCQTPEAWLGDRLDPIRTTILAVDEHPSPANTWVPPAMDGEQIAFLQYTSGSTASPKGVMLSHRNLLANHKMMQITFRQKDDASLVTWLPLFHDMGLIGHLLQAVYLGSTVTVMNPAHFIQNPVNWLRANSKYRAYISAAPNFAYQLCVDQIKPEECEGLDLRSWKIALNGAEPVRPATMKAFISRFEPYGFDPRAMYPGYGMAEAAVFISGAHTFRQPIYRTVDARAFAENTLLDAQPESRNPHTLVSCGTANPGETIRIVDPELLTTCSADQIGEIWLSGPHIGQGYWQRERATRETFQAYTSDTGEGPFLRTGDLGFLDPDSELFITGRIKDLIILRGQNYYPQDFEYTCENAHESLRAGSVAAFSVNDANGQELLVIVQEIERSFRKTKDFEPVFEAIRLAIAREHEIQPHSLLLVGPLQVPLTTSGKIRRGVCRQMYVENKFQVLASREYSPSSGESMAQGFRRPSDLGAPYQAPTNPTETRVAEIWSNILGIDKIGVHDDFFDLGGSSLQAMHMLKKVEASFGVQIPIAALSQVTTIFGISGRLTGVVAQPHTFSTLFPLKEGEGRCPLFLIPPAGYTALVFKHLAKHLPTGQPVFGLQPWGFEQQRKPHLRVEVMAADYIRQIKQVQPQGPYYIGGMCFGGTVAFEIASQLKKQEESIALLAVLDTIVPPLKRDLLLALRMFARLKRRRTDLTPIFIRNIRPLLQEEINLDPALEDHIQRIIIHHFIARALYRGRYYDGKITFFLPTGKTRRFANRRGWEQIAREVEFISIPGNHLSKHKNFYIKEPNVIVLADKLYHCLEAASAARAPLSTNSTENGSR